MYGSLGQTFDLNVHLALSGTREEFNHGEHREIQLRTKYKVLLPNSSFLIPPS